MIRQRINAAVLTSLLLLTTACTSYNPIVASNVGEYSRVRVGLANGQRMTVRDPVLVADTLRGTDSQRVSIPMDDVRWVKGVGTNGGATLLTVLGVTVVALTAVMAISICSDDFFDC